MARPEVQDQDSPAGGHLYDHRALRLQLLPVRWDHRATLQLPGRSVQVLERQLPAMRVGRAYDAHMGPPRAPATNWDNGPVR